MYLWGYNRSYPRGHEAALLKDSSSPIFFLLVFYFLVENFSLELYHSLHHSISNKYNIVVGLRSGSDMPIRFIDRII